MSPCGLIISLYGPVEGRRHDITLYRFSNIEDKLKAIHEDCGAYIYGDPAYMLRPWLITPLQRKCTCRSASIQQGYVKCSTIRRVGIRQSGESF
jgi:hypothetical protein